MRIFTCNACSMPVYFDSTFCTSCGAGLGFVPDGFEMVTLDADGSAAWGTAEAPRRYVKCQHHAQADGCNWMVAEEDGQPFCVSCRLNRTIPDLSVPGNRERWHRLEQEKRRLVYSALRLCLPVAPKTDREDGLAFDFLADAAPSFSERGRVLTGHDDGLITINIAEADPVERERMRNEMAEPYRTILGHFRHESGHYYWDVLISETPWIEPFRALFGDERRDYGEALEAHYETGPPAAWQDSYVSAYAASHPWEDWAESWSHYLHMVDTLETAWQFGLRLRPQASGSGALDAAPAFDPYRPAAFDDLITQWMPLTLALNSLNRSMGRDHFYPFALANPVIAKLRFVHAVMEGDPPPPA